MKKETCYYDVEVTPNRVMVGFKLNDKYYQFQHDETKKIRKFLSRDLTFVGFNNLKYDTKIVAQMLNGRDADTIYKTSYDLIENGTKPWLYDSIVDIIRGFDEVDIIEVAPSKASLKMYGARLDTKTIQDLPYSPHEKHTNKMWKHVCKYNKIDLDVTQELHEELCKLDRMNIRENLSKQYGIDARSLSDAQISERAFLKVLGITKRPKIKVPKSVTYTAPNYIKFKSKQLNELKDRFNDWTFEVDAKTGKIKSPTWLNDPVFIGDVKCVVGIGGMHSNEKSVSYVGNVQNADIASMYPSLIINSGKYPEQLGKQWRVEYIRMRDNRVEIKHTDKQLSAVLKIMLNGGFGKLGSVYSPLYAPHLLLDTTLTGQLSILMVVEALIDANIKVLSVNTDGVEYVCDDDTGQKIIDRLGKDMKLDWEHAKYNALHSRDVNSYVAVYDGYVKGKGSYAPPSLDKNKEATIVNEAIYDFLLNGTSIVDTITKCTDVTKFVTIRQVTGGAVWSDTAYPNTEEYEEYVKKVPFKQNKALEKRNDNYKKQFVLLDINSNYIGKVVRYYYSTKGFTMFYAKSANKVPSSDGCRPMMKLKKKIPKDLDYDRYIQICKDNIKVLGYEGKIV